MKKKKTVLLWGMLTLLGALLALILPMSVNLRPLVLATAEARVRTIALDAINNAVNNAVADIRYDDLVSIQYDQMGRITLLQANTIGMNQLSTRVSIVAQEYIVDIGEQPIRISTGSLTGNPLFAGQGPTFLVRVVPSGAVFSEFITEFESAGINQTRHKVFIRVKARMRILIPTGAKQVEVISQIPVAETVIVGEVPHSYVNVESTDDMLNLIPEIE